MLFCAHRAWGLELLERVRAQHPSIEFVHISSPEELTVESVKRARPRLALFPDWSWRVPTEVLLATTCIGFHAAPLPAFRGGSPIQNQIAAGVTDTAVTAFRMQARFDAGEILLTSPLSLRGSLRQIFGRIKRSIAWMIDKILRGEYSARPQAGPSNYVRRRRAEQSEIPDLQWPLARLYDHIRMLADPYPNAFIRRDGKRLTFKDARFDGETLRFRGEITCESS